MTRRLRIGRQLLLTVIRSDAITPFAAVQVRGNNRPRAGGTLVNRFILVAIAGIVASLTGCASSARMVERQPTGGVVAVPDYRHRDEGLALIRTQVGRDFVVVDEREVPTGTVTRSTDQKHQGSVFARAATWMTGRDETESHMTSTGATTEYRITYAKPVPGQPGAPSSTGVPPTGQQTIQTQYLSPNTTPVPSVLPAQPAPPPSGGLQSRLSLFESGPCTT